jgi:hypothetical protein
MKEKIKPLLEVVLSLIIIYSFFHVILDDILQINLFTKIIMAVSATIILIYFAINASSKFLKNIFIIGAIIYAIINLLVLLF